MLPYFAAPEIGDAPDGARRRRRDAHLMNVEAFMTKDVHTVAPDTLLKDVAALLGERRISGAPVCDVSSTARSTRLRRASSVRP
jgi:CBS-domain-containing membrane protein